MCKIRFRKIILILLIMAITILLSACGFQNISKKKIKDVNYTIVPENEIPSQVMEIINQKKNAEFRVAYSDPEYTYIIIGYGEQEYEGYTINIDKLYETSNAVYVKTTFDGPTEYTNIHTKTYPYIVIKMETINKNIVFENK